MRRVAGNIISVIVTLIKFTVIKIRLRGDFNFSLIERFSPNVVTEFNGGSKVFLGNKVRVHSGSKIKARRGAVLKIEDNVKINYNCIIVCRSKIHIGKGTEFGPNVFLYDHDHDYRSGLQKGLMTNGEITIGENSWIGAGAIILKNTHIGNNCVVAAGTVLSGTYPDNTMIVQKRKTESNVILHE